MRDTARPSPFVHPLWLLGLAVLVLNDHVFKTQPALAGALTGKLSDVAGLIVAPVLFATLLRARTRRARNACIALVGAGFVAIKVSPPCAALAEQLLGRLGVPSRIWVDPTDLLALPALLVAGRILGRQEPAPRWFARTAMLTGLWACVATSEITPEPGAALVNRRHAPLSARIAWGPAPDCDTFTLEGVRALTRRDFGEPTVVHLQAQHWRRLDDYECGVVWLTIEGEFDGVVAWEDLPVRVRDGDPISGALLDIAVTVEGSADTLRVTVGDELASFPSPAER